MFQFFKQKSVLLGTGLIASLGAYFFFFRQEAEKKSVKKNSKKEDTPKTVSKSTDQLLSEFIELMNLREVGNKDKIIALTKGKTDFLHASFYAEAMSTSGNEQEANKLLNEIASAKSDDPIDLFAIGKCLQLMNKKDQALPYYRKAAEGGCAFAYSHIGVYYQHGMGVEADINEAVRFYKLGVKHKDPLSKYLYALLLHQGEAVQQNEDLCQKYLDQSAKAGYIPAMLTMAELGLTTNPQESIKLFDELIEKYQFTPAITKKGLCMMQGLGCEKNEQEAVKLIIQAATSGDENAQDIHVSLLAESEPNKAFEVLKGYVTARAHATTLYRLGQFYQAGIGVKKNLVNAYKMYETAAEIGSLDALYILGISALTGVKGEDGFEFPKNEQVAEDFLLTAAQAGHPGAMQFLEQMMQYGGQQ